MTIPELQELADEFDRQRNCGWNNSNIPSDYDAPDFQASKVPEFYSLGSQCFGTLQELAPLHTLRPCRNCGGDFLYKSNFQIACCSCFGDRDECDDL